MNKSISVIVSLVAICVSLASMAATNANIIPTTAIRTQSVNSICTTSTSTLRNVTESTKKAVYANARVPYGDRTMCVNGYEVDHIISLTLGGSNDISNLQLQAYCTYGELTATDGKPMADKNGKIRIGAVPKYKGLYDARAKDVQENALHRDICSTRKTPAQAQSIIWNWKK